MFGLNKIKEAQKKAEELKNSLNSMEFEGESMNGMVKAHCNGAKQFTNIVINESVYRVRELDEVQDMIKEAVNEAIYKADMAAKDKMSDILPNIPGLNL